MVKFADKDENFESGAKRGDRTGKGRYDLIPEEGLKRLAKVYEEGAVKYGDSNWKKGYNISRTLDSAIRHLYNYMGGDNSEDHLAQACWNLMAAMYFEEVKPEFQDIPERKVKDDN